MNEHRFEKDELSRKGSLKLSGELTIQGASDLRELFIETLNKTDELVVDLSEVEEFDLACLQLCFSLSKTAVALNKSVTFSDNGNRRVQNLINTSGFMNKKEFSRVSSRKEKENV